MGGAFWICSKKEVFFPRRLWSSAAQSIEVMPSTIACVRSTDPMRDWIWLMMKLHMITVVITSTITPIANHLSGMYSFQWNPGRRSRDWISVGVADVCACGYGVASERCANWQSCDECPHCVAERCAFSVSDGHSGVGCAYVRA